MKKKELENFKKLLEEKRERVIRNINDSSKDIEDLRQNGVADEIDMASMTADSNLEYSLSAIQHKELNEIEQALNKISDGTYGICEMCEEEISPARLKINPTARLCITCKEISEKKIR